MRCVNQWTMWNARRAHSRAVVVQGNKLGHRTPCASDAQLAIEQLRMYTREHALPDFVLARRKRSSSSRRRLKHSSANFVSKCTVGKNMASCTKNRRTCDFTSENLCFSSLLFALAGFEEVFSRVLKNVIGKQTIHNVFDISER